MTTGVESLAVGIVDALNVPALVKVGPNFRVTTPTGPIGVVGDVVTFSGPPVTPTLTGAWVSGALRTTINSLPVINQTAVGASVTFLGTPGGPIRVSIPDARVSAG